MYGYDIITKVPIVSKETLWRAKTKTNSSSSIERQNSSYCFFIVIVSSTDSCHQVVLLFNLNWMSKKDDPFKRHHKTYLFITMFDHLLLNQLRKSCRHFYENLVSSILLIWELLQIVNCFNWCNTALVSSTSFIPLKILENW